MKYLSKSENLKKNKFHKTSFNKKELGLILRVYCKMVALGHWKDYSISMSDGISVFSIYKNSSDRPILNIKKTKIKNNDFIYSVISMNGKILKKGNDLTQVSKMLEIRLV